MHVLAFFNRRLRFCYDFARRGRLNSSVVYFFFFSSRRRHTRLQGDWSSDVCSSDLNRLAWIGGKFEDRDERGVLLRERIELRKEPKYPAVNRWHIERWVPPEVYGSPRTWYAQTNELAGGQNIAALGPYPSRGEYEHCFTLETPKGEFIQLTPTIAEHIARAIEYSRCAPRAQKRARIYQQKAREDRAYEDWAFDLLDDATPAFHKQPFVTGT